MFISADRNDFLVIHAIKLFSKIQMPISKRQVDRQLSIRSLLNFWSDYCEP